MYSESELYHHGILGMKWGVKRANRTISRANMSRKNNKNTYDQMNKESIETYGDNKKKLKKDLASNKAMYDTSEVANKYAIAKSKAKLDKSYKDSNEYKTAKMAYSKQRTQQMLFGTWGHQKIETLKNMGESSGEAKAKTFAKEAAAAVVVSGLVSAYYKLH